MEQTVVGQHVGLDDFGVVEVDFVVLDADADSRAVVGLVDLAVFEVGGVGDLLEGVGTKER